MTPRKPSFVLPFAVTLAVLLGLYVGAYYWSVDRVASFDGDGWIDYRTPAGYVPMYPRFHGHDPAGFDRRLRPCVAFFSPMHWLDRRIRPHVWEPGP